jgi:hypothetical protein
MDLHKYRNLDGPMTFGDAFDKVNTSVGQVILAFLGGLISVLMRKEASTWQTALLGAAGAGFVGFLVAHLCRAIGVSDDWSYVFVGVSGWLGAARTISYLEQLFAARLGLPVAPETKQDQAIPGATEKETQT